MNTATNLGTPTAGALRPSPYALEPLVLPHAGVRIREPGGNVSKAANAPISLGEITAADPLPAPAGPDELYWFRWIAGHQAVFAIWQLIDDELELVVRDHCEAAAARASTLINAYSVLLAYTGSPTRELYDRLIRPAMMRKHPSFSGRWAPDYVTVAQRLRTLRARYRREAAPVAIFELNRAGRRNHQFHMAVAAKLVPGGASLLRAGDDSAALGIPTGETQRLYDEFFATHRATPGRDEVISQLLRRLRAILLDLHNNGLFPADSSSAAECPEEMQGGELACFTSGPVPLLIAAGETICSHPG
ncbi:hypothetical protein [Streptomyces sp. NRRL S-244]|uniref:hypothetical protein n=1 Tax=Streptomyces sp. NRRL S-244 TaxID=1463897 RepID=UPI000A6FFA2F|nr:hypothetical protein [Streptomyces sp. NRRL S-244]